MLRSLDRLYRCVATGFAFAFIFAGGGVLAATVLPIASLTLGSDRARAQHVIHVIFRFYLGMLQWLRLLRLEIHGEERLRACRGLVIAANHPSLLDVVMLMALVPNAQCIVKHELWNHRFLGGLMRRAGYIRNDLDGEALVDACRAALQNGDNLIIFPEGTRSQPGSVPRLQRGFANIATLTGAEVQLVVITCTPPTLVKGEPWWAVPEERPVFRLVVDRRIDTSIYLALNNRSLASRRMTEQVESYYTEKLANV